MADLQELLNYTKKLKVLFAEDHDELRRNTTIVLKNFFEEVIPAKDGKEAFELYIKFPQKYDIILSDIEMPYINGVELTEKIYKINSKQPIIILSAYDESQYLLPLINLGIEQFIKKPIDYEMLVHVLLDVSKKISQGDKEIIKKSEFFINSDTLYHREKKKLIIDGEDINITKFEIILLDLLTKEQQKIYSNDAIVEYYRSKDEVIDPQNIRKLVSKLRKKLPNNSLKSIYGVGYRLLSI